MFGIDLGSLVVYLRTNSTQFQQGLKSAEQQMKATAAVMKSTGVAMSMYVTAPLALIGGASVKAFANFDQAMTESLAIQKNVGEAMRAEMEATARELSTKSITSATDLARAYYYLASAGLDAEKSVAALETVNNFAVAGMFDMSQATTMLANSQSALGMKVENTTQNMKNMTRIADVLVGANTLADATVEQFARSLTNKAAASMKALNMSVEEGVSVLADFAEQGIKGQRGGQAFEIVTRDLQQAALRSKDAWEKMGISIYDAQEKFRPFADIIEDLTLRFSTMTDKQKQQSAMQLGFQARSFSYLKMLLKTSDTMRGFQKRLEDMGGMTKQVADNQLKSFTSQMAILKNQVVDVAIGIGEQLAPYILRLNEYLQKGIDWWNKLDGGVKRVVVVVGLFVAAIGPVLLVLGTLASLAGTVVGMLASWPVVIGLIIAAVGGLVYKLVGKESLVNAWEVVKDAMVKFYHFTVGFVSNFSENIKILIEWLKENWKNMVFDLYNLWATQTKNMVGNLGIILKTALELFFYFQGYLTKIFDDLFQGDFVQTIKDALVDAFEALKKWADHALDMLAEWAVKAWDRIKGFFTGGKAKAADFGDYVEGFMEDLGDAWVGGFAATDFMGGAKKILEEGASQLKAPLEGFESTIKDLPEFKLDVAGPVEEVGKAIEQAKEQAEVPTEIEEAVEQQKNAVEERGEFQQIALNRLSLAGLAAGPPASQKQQVEAPGVNERLDTLINLQEQNNINQEEPVLV